MTRKRGPPGLLKVSLEKRRKQKSRNEDGAGDGSWNEQESRDLLSRVSEQTRK